MRTILASALALVILAGCVLLPPFVSEKGDKALLGKTITEENDLTLGAYSYTLTLAERLNLFADSREATRVMSQYMEVYDYIEISAALDKIAPEVDALKALGLFPEFVSPDFSGSSSYLGLITCYSLYDPYMSATYREVTASDVSFDITCLFRQDVESGHIIEFWVTGSGMSAETIFSAFDAVQLERLGDYLGLGAGESVETGDGTDAAIVILNAGEKAGDVNSVRRSCRFGSVTYEYTLDSYEQEDGYYFNYYVQVK